jgi:hypothetical protein
MGIAGSLGMSLNRQRVFQSPLLGGDLFAPGHKAFDVGFDRPVDRLPEGDASGKGGDDGAVASFRLFFEQDSISSS